MASNSTNPCPFGNPNCTVDHGISTPSSGSGSNRGSSSGNSDAVSRALAAALGLPSDIGVQVVGGSGFGGISDFIKALKGASGPVTFIGRPYTEDEASKAIDRVARQEALGQRADIASYVTELTTAIDATTTHVESLASAPAIGSEEARANRASSITSGQDSLARVKQVLAFANAALARLDAKNSPAAAPAAASSGNVAAKVAHFNSVLPATTGKTDNDSGSESDGTSSQ